jgi:hypothetical protein
MAHLARPPGTHGTRVYPEKEDPTGAQSRGVPEPGRRAEAAGKRTQGIPNEPSPKTGQCLIASRPAGWNMKARCRKMERVRLW